jgi:hypothetical protein
MALKLDNSLLEELGLGGLPEAEKQSLLRHIYETLEMRVGMRLADQMSNEQLDEFEQYVNANDDAGAFKWLESNFPNYKDVVNDEFEKLKAEVRQAAPQIIAGGGSSQQGTQPDAAQQQPQQPAPVQQYPQQTQQPPAPAQPYAQPGFPQQSPSSYPANQPQYPSQQPPAGPGPQQPPYPPAQ